MTAFIGAIVSPRVERERVADHAKARVHVEPARGDDVLLRERTGR